MGRFKIYEYHSLYSAKLWTGNTWQTLVEGRGQDYFYEPERGMVFFTRLFILPALYSPVGRYSWWWGYGEYKMNLNFHYSYGKNWETEPTASEINELAIKMVAIDLINTSDYTTLIVSGTDKIDYTEKISNWKEEIKEKIEELSAFYTY